MLAPETRLGPYTIVGLLGVGGMGEVYRAHDSRLERDVAVKVLPPELADDGRALERFRRETRAVAALSHPNILAIFDVGSENGVHYAVTELLEGETLRNRVARSRLTPREALEVMLQIAEGVAAAHARGIVHRDLKPENIFITTSGRTKVLDFGLARGGTGPIAAAATSPTAILPTEPGVVLGTMGYAAPEQIEARGVTPATDVFALGCVLYEMVTGRLPFERTSAISQMVALLHDPAPRLQGTGESLLRDIDVIVQHCLAKKPADRLANAGELASEIRGVLDGQGPTRRLPNPASRKWLMAAIATVLLIAAPAFFINRSRNRQIDHGYDLRVTDIRADRETRQLVELALRADAEGNRPKAIELFEEAWRRPSATPFPAAFLSSFADAAGKPADGRAWAKKAYERLASGSPSTYESLLARYLATSSSQRNHELALAKSALELRPAAWRLRLAAAHILLGQRDREAARRELQHIDVSKPDDRRLMLVLADRASLGDTDGALRDLRRSRLQSRPPFRAYVEARVAWTRGEIERATELFDQSASTAADEGLGTIEVEAHLLAGIAMLRLGKLDEAQRRFALTATRARQLGLSVRIFDASAFAAYTAWRDGDDELRDRRLNEAASVQPPAAPWAALRLLAIRMDSPLWRSWSTEPIEKEPLLAPVLSLIRAREAFATGDVDGARRELRGARAEGIDSSEMREEAELLAKELGLPAETLPADPPYPNPLRYMAIFDSGEQASRPPRPGIVPGRTP